MKKTATNIPLQDLVPGQPANIASLDGQPRDVARLAEMGLQRGTAVSVIRGGKTCILQLLGGNRMCVRASNELKILVTPA